MRKKNSNMGRPPKPKAELQVESIFVRVSAAEKRTIEQAAGGVLVSRWARETLLRAARRILRQAE
jgi:hypothetical protein